MSLVARILRQGRVRDAKRAVARDPSAKNYALLAQECARAGDLEQAEKTCEEGLGLFPGNKELLRLQERAGELVRETRIRELTREVRESPRPAVWRELCETLLEAGRVDRAEEFAEEWFRESGDGHARLFCAQARADRFFADRRREDGLLAFRFLEEAERLLPRDQKPVRLRLQLTSRAGAWKEARKAAARLLELAPGDLALEARFRSLLALSENAHPLEHALREVEITGRLADDDPELSSAEPESGSVRPLLQALASEAGVAAAVYSRGGTALIQGPKGASAERMARAVRDVIQKSRNHARRLGLGHPHEIRVEGSFGTLIAVSGELAAGALWCRGAVNPVHERALQELAGLLHETEENEP